MVIPAFPDSLTSSRTLRHTMMVARDSLPSWVLHGKCGPVWRSRLGENGTVTHFLVMALSSCKNFHKLICILFFFLASIIILNFWLKESFYGESSAFSFLIMSQVLVFVIWMHLCYFWDSSVLAFYDFSFLVTIDMDPAHLTQQLSSALGICSYNSIHEEKKEHSVAMIYKD